MNLIKTTFTIGEIEDLTGIKAHTIRVWEKRYQILEPLRKETKSRIYTNTDLQKLLNISVLIQNGHKISKVATYTATEIENFIVHLKINDSDSESILHQLRLSMMTYNEIAFLNIYKKVRETRSLRDVFKNFILNLLEQTGLLWQTNQILPTHEHFVSNVIRMILISETYRLENPKKTNPTFVLFTPLHEIHELALLFIQYEIKRKGFTCIYLGTHVPTDSLKSVQKQHENLIYLGYTTIEPATAFEKYLNLLITEINLEKNKIWLAGRKVDLSTPINHENIKLFDSVANILAVLDEMI